MYKGSCVEVVAFSGVIRKTDRDRSCLEHNYSTCNICEEFSKNYKEPVIVFFVELDLDFICKDVFLVEEEDHGGLFEEAIVTNRSEEFERFVKSKITIRANKLGCFIAVKICYCLLELS